MSRPGRFRKAAEWGTLTLVVAGLLAIAPTIIAPAFGRTAFVVRSASMAPTLPTGSLVFVDPRRAPAVGDMVTVELSAGVFVTHRLVEIMGSADDIMWHLRGDAQDSVEQVVSASWFVGTVDLVIPLAGYARAFVRTPVGIAAVLLLAAALTILAVPRRRLRPMIHAGLVLVMLGGSGAAGASTLGLFTVSRDLLSGQFSAAAFHFYLHSADWGAARGIPPGHGGIPPGQGGTPPGQGGGGNEPGLYAMDTVTPTSTSIKTFDPAANIKWGTMLAVSERWIGGGTVGFWTETAQGKAGTLNLALFDHDPVSGVDIAISSVSYTRPDWMLGRTQPFFAEFALGSSDYLLPAGHGIILLATSPTGSMKVYYDSTVYSSFLRLQ